ncbi:DUF1761 domain-containing protein [Acidobacteria bacterium AB60]|nr:DUF1761 domain-containing protein [Acidobacteria bacterium AB60]
MLIVLWLVLCLAAASLMLLPLALRLCALYRQYSGTRLVSCPEDRKASAVHIDTWRAVETGMDASPDLRLCECTRWPERAHCNQACMGQVVAHDSDLEVEPRVGRKQIYHLPIVLAAFAAWYIGAVWHSQYLFRGRWLAALGLTREDVSQAVWWFWPHLLSAAICLLFAYGVAWLLAVIHRKGVLSGILMAILLGGAIVAASWSGIARLPRELQRIEGAYVLLAALTIGAIVGGFSDRLVLPRPGPAAVTGRKSA